MLLGVMTGANPLMGDAFWTGAGSNSNLSNPENWQSEEAPNTGWNGSGHLHFGDLPGNDQIVTFHGSSHIGKISIDSSLDYNLGGGSIVTGKAPSEWTIAGSGHHTVDMSIDLQADLTVLNHGTGSFGLDAHISNWGNGNLTLGGTGTTVFDGSLRGGVELSITGGHNTIRAAMEGGKTINVTGGTNIFDTSFAGGTTLNFLDGDNHIAGDIGGGAEIEVNAHGGSLSVAGQIGGGSQVDVLAGSLTLTGGVDPGALILVDQGGTLLLTDGAHVGDGGVLELDGGTLVFEGNVNVPNLTLSGDSVIDLGNDPNAQVNIGNITGDGTVNVINYVNSNQVAFNPGGTHIEVTEQVTFEGSPSRIDGPDGNILVPDAPPVVPEPATSAGLLAFVSFVAFHGYRRWRASQGT